MNDWIGCLGKTPRGHHSEYRQVGQEESQLHQRPHRRGLHPSEPPFSGQFASTTSAAKAASMDHPEIKIAQTQARRRLELLHLQGRASSSTTGRRDRCPRRQDPASFSQRATGNGMACELMEQEETPFPEPFPASIYNRGQEITRRMFLEWASAAIKIKRKWRIRRSIGRSNN